MKSLLVMRHAKSSWKDSMLPDHERPLNKRGKRAAPSMGKRLLELDLIPDRIISSTARRAKDTTELVIQSCGYDGEVQFMDELYHNGPTAWLSILAAVPNEPSRVMLVGHNPGLEEFIEMLTGQSQQLRTAVIAHITLAITKWQELSPQSIGQLAGLWEPERETT